jgi:hypothetical protein
MSDRSLIVCKVTPWFIWRAVLMLVMFGGFAGYFLYDWKIGYPQKNVVVAYYQAFSEAGSAWTDPEKRERWADYVSEQKIPWGNDLTIYPPETDFDARWPKLLADAKAMDEKSDEGLWIDYAAEKKWPQQVDLDEDPKPSYKIKEQYYAAIVCGVLTLITLFFFFRTSRRKMSVDDDAFITPDGVKIPYHQMISIDKRKWETKGLASITYTNQEGVESKAKVDGMVYGQFKEEEGAPAEALFQKILSNFDGELVELVSLEEEEREGVEESCDSETDSASSGETPEEIEKPRDH